MVTVYETQMKFSDNGLTNLKRGTGQVSRKLVNANQPGRSNNLNAGPKSDKIAKNIINVLKSHNSKNPNFVPDQQLLKEIGATSPKKS